MLSLRAFLCANLLLAALPASASYTEDRAVAEWVLRSGGSVAFAGDSRFIRDIAGIPAGPVRLRSVDLVSVVVAPDDLKRLTGLTHLRELYLSGRTWHSLPNEAAVRSLSFL